MLLVDGVKYRLWTPKKELQLEEILKEHSKEIFGEDSLYFDVKRRISSKSRIVSIPDGYLIDFYDDYPWYVVEVELSRHSPHKHIVSQLNKFRSGIKNPETQKEIVDALYSDIKDDPFKEAFVKKKLDTKDMHHFLSKTISEKEPEYIIVIDELKEELEEACEIFDPWFIEIKTFVREGVGIGSHAHLINVP